VLALELQMNRPEAFDAALDGQHRNLRLLQFRREARPQVVEQSLRRAAAALDLQPQCLVRGRLEVAKCEFLELVLDLAHPEPVRDGRIDVARLLGNADPPFLRQMMERPHVVEPVREFDQDHPDVVDHGQEHLAEALGLPLLA
jgi:hypothetical protein